MAGAKTKKSQGNTPLMRQYYKIKGRHPNAILLFRMGDFYETFEDDHAEDFPKYMICGHSRHIVGVARRAVEPTPFPSVKAISEVTEGWHCPIFD